MDTLFRHVNLWILQSCDIRTSVFPSGHVAVGFSAAFALLLVLPEKRWIGYSFVGLALLVWINTIYGRYHYAADGLMSIAISALAVALSCAVFPWLSQMTVRRSA